jgi:hypothetical protein
VTYPTPDTLRDPAEAAARGQLFFVRPGGSADDHTKAETALLLKGDAGATLVEFGDSARSRLHLLASGDDAVEQ